MIRCDTCGSVGKVRGQGQLQNSLWEFDAFHCVKECTDLRVSLLIHTNLNYFVLEGELNFVNTTVTKKLYWSAAMTQSPYKSVQWYCCRNQSSILNHCVAKCHSVCMYEWKVSEETWGIILMTHFYSDIKAFTLIQNVVWWKKPAT